MSTRELTAEAIRRGLITSSGATPDATMSAALYGLPPGTPITREFVPGAQRARRGSVRWRYVGDS